MVHHVDQSNRFYQLVEYFRNDHHHHKTKVDFQTAITSACDVPRNSLSAVADTLTTEICNIQKTVRKECKKCIDNLCYGMTLNTDTLNSTEQLLGGANQHVGQFSSLISTRTAHLNQHQLLYLNAVVASLRELLQECTTPLNLIRNTYQTVTSDVHTYQKGNCFIPPPPVPVTSSVSDRSRKGETTCGSKDDDDTAIIDNGVISHPIRMATAAAGDENRKTMQVEGIRNRRFRRTYNTAFTTTQSSITEYNERDDDALNNQLETENRLLFMHYNNITNDLRDVEISALSISKLAGLFTDKVDEQNTQIEEALECAQTSTDLIKQSTRHITQATKRGLSFRFFILIVLILFSFTLLFLHFIIP
jgi:hypothetical protein